MKNITCTIPVEIGGEEIELQCSGTLTPFWQGDYYNPPEGGEFEDVVVQHPDGTKLTDEDMAMLGISFDLVIEELNNAV
jgi:hypothetical protein